LLARVRQKLRTLGSSFDAAEVLQDAIINVYRYPAKFDASRAGAFAAWSTAIVDNAIRRQLRQRKVGVPMSLTPSEVLEQHASASAVSPDQEAEDHEEGEREDVHSWRTSLVHGCVVRVIRRAQYQANLTAVRLKEPYSQPSMGKLTGPLLTEAAPAATSKGTKWSSLGCACCKPGARSRYANKVSCWCVRNCSRVHASKSVAHVAGALACVQSSCRRLCTMPPLAKSSTPS
jgi:hypothetical protein